MTDISVIDRPCGIGKSTGLIAYLKTTKIKKILLVVPELGEVTRFTGALGYEAPVASPTASKTVQLIDMLNRGVNVVITHSLYERIRRFDHLLPSYSVVIDEVPTVAKQVHTVFGPGVFSNLLYEKPYIKIDPDTQLITATGNWLVDEDAYGDGSDVDIQKFMAKIQSADVYYIKGTYCLMPLPDAFFTKPKSLTILTFMFKGTQLEHYMSKRGYEYTIQSDPNELALFKYEMNSLLQVFNRTTDVKTGYEVMTAKASKKRKMVGHWIKNVMQTLNKGGTVFTPDMILAASSKDAWYGKEENDNSKVTNATSLKTLSRLGKATYTAMVTRGTNKFKDKTVLVIAGKVNLHPDLAQYLGMQTKEAKDAHTLSELIQLIYRTGIRDKKEVFLISADADNIDLLREFITT